MPVPIGVSEVAVHVYSVDYALKCRICSISGRQIRVSPEASKVDMFQLNDPVVCLYLDNGCLVFKGGDIIAVDSVGCTVDICIADEIAQEERRTFERFPVSIPVSARRKFTNKRLHLVARNISEYGMSAISSVDLDINESIDIDLITGKYMFYFVGKAIWKKPASNNYEYGFQLTNFDVATKSSMEAYLGKLKEEYLGLYRKAR